MTVDELQVLITANTNELRKEIGNANKNISGLQKSASKSSAGVTSAFSKLKKGIIALGIGKVIKDSISAGMDAIESDSLFTTVMGDNADAVKAWSNDIADTLGLSAVAMQKNIGVIYNMTSSMGVAGDNALKMSKGVSVLAEDMASFYNLDSDEAFNKLRAGLTGETEPLKALGILVDENTVKQVAYSEGIAENGAELTQQQKVLARYVAILKQTGNAQGDLARTLNSPSNQLRSLKQNVQNLGIAFSKILMPIVQAVLPWLNALAKVATQAVNSLAALFGVSSGGGAAENTKAVSDNVGGIGDGLDNASKKAKKLKQSLAGFDEMNVLQDNSADSESGGGGGATGADIGFNLDEYNAHLDWADSKTGELVKKIQDAFSKLGEGINWSKLKKAFLGVYDAVKPIASKIWDGLKWGWDNILVPLAKWSINDVLPAFLNLVRGALELLSPVLSVVGDAFMYLWDNLLKPLATWTGGVVVDVLNNVGTALSNIGAWIETNRGNLDTAPFDALMGTVSSYGSWLLEWWDMLGSTISTNISKTWENISGNAGIAVSNMIDTWTMFWTDIQGGIDTWGQPFIEGVRGVFNSLWKDVVDPICQQLTQVWADWTQIIKDLWDEHGGALVNNVGEFITNIVGLFQSLWDKILAPIIVPFLEMLTDVWNKHIKGMVKQIGDFIMTLVNGALEIWNKFIQPIIMWIADKLSPVFAFLGQLVAGVFGTIIGVVSDVIGGIMKALKGIINFITGIFTGNWEKAWKGIADFFGGIWDGVVGIFKGVINVVIDIINAIISGINKLHWEVPDWVPLIGGKEFGFNIPKIPKLARGGIVDKPTYAMVGEAGKEAVMPLERNTGWIDQLADKLADKIGGGGNGEMKLTVKLGEDTIFDKFIEFSRDKFFETNGEVVFA